MKYKECPRGFVRGNCPSIRAAYNTSKLRPGCVPSAHVKVANGQQTRTERIKNPYCVNMNRIKLENIFIS